VKKAGGSGQTTFVESDGGLVSSLKSYLEKENSGDGRSVVWIGAADFSRKSWDRFIKTNQIQFSYRMEPVFAEDRVFNKYYNGFCNATIWPLFHYFPSFADFENETFESYEVVNRAFCDKVLSIAKPGDTIWIHDYHLLLLPEMLRKALPDIAIGFFLHIPFPSFDVFRLMHTDWKEKLIHGMLGADLIGFHTYEYVQHFLKTMRMVTGYDHRFREIHKKTSIVHADLFPLGIDYEKFNGAADVPKVQEFKKPILEKFSGLKIIFSVDRLDYTKGVTHRLSGFAKFLELYPEWQGKVVFIMVVVPSRQIVSKYNERLKLIEEQVGRINGNYSTLEWQPVLYRYNQLEFDELCALYQVADVALITPLRDGMNLVAKEYVASRVNEDGVLILGELAGAANELGEAMLVNPTDRDDVARNIEAALQCPIELQQANMRPMRERMKNTDVSLWVKEFFTELALVKQRQQENQIVLINDQTIGSISTKYQQADRRLLFLDYDGTLMPIMRKPNLSAPDPQVLTLLGDLALSESTEVVIISGRNFQILEDWLGHLPIHLVAEHGASFRLKGGKWQHHTDVDPSWKNLIRSTFEMITKRSPGSFVEEKKYTIAWHYREMESAVGFSRSRELLDNLYHLIRNTHLNVLDGNKVVEVRAAGIDKGVATRKFVDLFPSDFVFAIGDDKTDEDIFQVLQQSAVTVKVGEDMTSAKFSVANQQDAFNLLRHLSMLVEAPVR
jgi:trehalose 6-phosphate synthase/phosphatase